MVPSRRHRQRLHADFNRPTTLFRRICGSRRRRRRPPTNFSGLASKNHLRILRARHSTKSVKQSDDFTTLFESGPWRLRISAGYRRSTGYSVWTRPVLNPKSRVLQAEASSG